jgi:hypothetical protein
LLPPALLTVKLKIRFPRVVGTSFFVPVGVVTTRGNPENEGLAVILGVLV